MEISPNPVPVVDKDKLELPRNILATKVMNLQERNNPIHSHHLHPKSRL
jgi:hypothetical protein